ncbi:MAG: hypothetical protein H0W88_02375 [Parachlamydiaceae bacterium]|nr:hypothetical protein [Parachlamydiaceae bacterium]
MLIIKSSSANPYKHSNEYQQKTSEKDFEYNGEIYHKKITYEKTLNTIYCIAIGALALLSTLTIVPYYYDSQTVKMWWQQAVSGIDRKIVLIKEKNEKQVRFDQVRGRCFDKENPPADIQNILSIELKDKNQKNLTNAGAPQIRKIPPVGICDTVMLSKAGVVKSVHGSGELFSDSEIVEKLDIVKTKEIAPGISVGYTKYEKAIIQQQATRGCTAAAAAMLIMDNGKNPNLHGLQTRNIGYDDDHVRDFKEAGLLISLNPADSLLGLRTLLIKNGPAIVTICGKLGGHDMLVDEVSEDLSRVRIRDPYHGWEITITAEAFLKEWKPGEIIQIKKN